MQVKFKVKAENIGSVVLDDPNKEEKEKKKLVIPALPSLENLFSQEEIFYETQSLDDKTISDQITLQSKQSFKFDLEDDLEDLPTKLSRKESGIETEFAAQKLNKI